MNDRNLIGAGELVITHLLADADLRKAVIFLDRTVTVKATRTRRYRKGARTETFVVTMGRPNLRERQRIQRKGPPRGVILYPYKEAKA